MKKYLKDFEVRDNRQFANGTSVVKLFPVDGQLPEMLPGQFVNILVSNCDGVFLRRPISIYYADYSEKSLSLYIKRVGKGSNALCESAPGDRWNILLPLGNGFDLEEAVKYKHPLLVGGGVGMAPMLYLGARLKEKGVTPSFLLGGANDMDFPIAEQFEKVGKTFYTTVDGSRGVKGFVTDHEVMGEGEADVIFCCGPTPMMKALATLSRERGVECFVSLENTMACGLGACLCCVEDTREGNRCVCTDGPVFNVNELKW